MNFAKATIGEQGFIFLIGVVGVIFLVSFLILIIRKRPSFLRLLIFIAVLIIGMWFCWQLKIPAERIHILEYAVLGYFAAGDLAKADKRLHNLMIAFLFCFAVGVLDEGFQKILPYRVFDLRDIVFNGLGGLFGITLYLVK